MKGLITLVVIILMIGAVVGATATWTVMRFSRGAVYRAR